MKVLSIGFIFASVFLIGCASKSLKSAAAPADDAWAVFFPQKANDSTGKLALSYELHPVRPDTRIQIRDLRYDFSPLPVNQDDAFRDEGNKMVSGFYRGDLVDTPYHELK